MHNLSVRTASRGVSLMELLVVMAIISMLAAIAIPSYLQYTSRARVMEGITLAEPVKVDIADYYLQHNTLPAPEAVQAPAATRLVDSIKWDGRAIVITYASTVVKAEEGNTLTLVPSVENGALQWHCSGTLPAGYRPANCADTSRAT